MPSSDPNDPFSYIKALSCMFGAGEANHFKIGMLIDHSEY